MNHRLVGNDFVNRGGPERVYEAGWCGILAAQMPLNAHSHSDAPWSVGGSEFYHRGIFLTPAFSASFGWNPSMPVCQKMKLGTSVASFDAAFLNWQIHVRRHSARGKRMGLPLDVAVCSLAVNLVGCQVAILESFVPLMINTAGYSSRPSHDGISNIFYSGVCSPKALAWSRHHRRLLVMGLEWGQTRSIARDRSPMACDYRLDRRKVNCSIREFLRLVHVALRLCRWPRSSDQPA